MAPPTALYLSTPPETSEYMVGNLPDSPHTICFSDETSITSSLPSPHMRDLLAAPETSVDFINFPRTSAKKYDLHRSPSLPPTILDSQDVDEEVIRGDAGGALWDVLQWSANDLPDQMVLSESRANLAFVSAFDIFQRPHFLPSSAEMIRSYFDKNTCGIMSVKDGPTENPWRMELWPMAQDSPALLHAISAMTAFHMSLEYPNMKGEGREHQRKSLRFLNQGFSHTNIQDDAALATTLVLAFAEAFDSPETSGTVHLRGGRGLIYKVLERLEWLSGNQIFMRRFKFLYNVWVYLDVLARLTSDVDNDVQSPIFHGPFESSPEVDPLLGCADTLFPLIRRAASIGHRVRRCKRNTVNIVSEAAELQKQLEDWQPHSQFDYEPIQDSSSNVSHCMQTAEAYRTATLLHLHQAVPELPSPNSHYLAEKVIMLLASIPASSRSCITHIYPLLAAGCEASGDEEREWVRKRWVSMEHRLRLGNVQKALQVTREVWDRRDKFISQQGVSSENHRPPSRHNLQHNSPPTELSPSSSQDTLEWEHSPSYARQRSPGSSFSDCGTKWLGPDALRDGELEYELSVRGRLHWARVMADWNWEG